MSDITDKLELQEQLEYYRARAAEYDDWWWRRGRYDRGAEMNRRWWADAEAVRGALREFGPTGDVLELACGTGLWTEQLLPQAKSVTAVDGSAEMLALTAERVKAAKVRLVQADLFEWQPERKYDTIFFGFWLSHVPPSRFTAFWQLVGDALAPAGRVFFVDSRHDATSTAKDHRLPTAEQTRLLRRLNDGREFQIYKVFYDAADLTARLRSLGWTMSIRQTAHYFLCGSGHLADEG